MARTPPKSSAPGPAGRAGKAQPTSAGGSRPASIRERVVESLMRLLAEKPQRFVKRVERYWSAGEL